MYSKKLNNNKEISGAEQISDLLIGNDAEPKDYKNIITELVKILSVTHKIIDDEEGILFKVRDSLLNDYNLENMEEENKQVSNGCFTLKKSRVGKNGSSTRSLPSTILPPTLVEEIKTAVGPYDSTVIDIREWLMKFETVVTRFGVDFDNDENALTRLVDKLLPSDVVEVYFEPYPESWDSARASLLETSQYISDTAWDQRQLTRLRELPGDNLWTLLTSSRKLTNSMYNPPNVSDLYAIYDRLGIDVQYTLLWPTFPQNSVYCFLSAALKSPIIKKLKPKKSSKSSSTDSNAPWKKWVSNSFDNNESLIGLESNNNNNDINKLVLNRKLGKFKKSS